MTEQQDGECVEVEGEVRIVGRYGEEVLNLRNERRTAGLRHDLASLRITLDYVADEIGRDAPDAEEAAVLLLKQRVLELEEHWRAVTLASAASDLRQTHDVVVEGPAGGELARVHKLS